MAVLWVVFVVFVLLGRLGGPVCAEALERGVVECARLQSSLGTAFGIFLCQLLFQHDTTP
jgi:hypothetical protein